MVSKFEEVKKVELVNNREKTYLRISKERHLGTRELNFYGYMHIKLKEEKFLEVILTQMYD